MRRAVGALCGERLVLASPQAHEAKVRLIDTETER